jgi:hypothetical protein
MAAMFAKAMDRRAMQIATMPLHQAANTMIAIFVGVRHFITPTNETGCPGIQR